MKWKMAFLASIVAALIGGWAGDVAKHRAADEERPQEGFKYFRGYKQSDAADQDSAKRAKLYGSILRKLYKSVTLPPAFDSVQKGWVPPIVNQSSCGSCWDFSGTGMVDIAFALAHAPDDAGRWKMSEQYTMDCGKNGGCSGDDNRTVLQWAQDTGLPLAVDYKAYQARRSQCQTPDASKLHKIETWALCDPSGKSGVCKAEYIKAAVMLYGSAGCAVAAGNGWDNYHGGVYNGSGNRGINHDVIIVGWDDSKSTHSGKTVWKMRNSWGTSWGDNGYMWIAEDGDLIGTDAVWCSAAAPPAPPPPPPPSPGAGWNGTITIKNGLIIDAAPSPN